MYLLSSHTEPLGANGRLRIPPRVRGPLGLGIGTPLHLAVTEPLNGRPGDLLLSTLELRDWQRHAMVNLPNNHSSSQELLEALSPNWHPTYSEIATLSGNANPTCALVLQGHYRLRDKARAMSDLIQIVSRHSPGATVSSFPSMACNLVWHSRAVIDRNGFVECIDNQQTSWHSTTAAQVKDLRSEGAYDTSQFLLSADLSYKICRITFLRLGARRLVFEYLDQPGVLNKIVTHLNASGVTILSSQLGRSSRRPLSARLSLICEPPSSRNSDSLDYQALKSLEETANVNHIQINPPYSTNVEHDDQLLTESLHFPIAASTTITVRRAPPQQLFISHAHVDAKTAALLFETMNEAFCGKVQIICTSLNPLAEDTFDQLGNVLRKLIDSSAIVLLLVTPRTPTRMWVAWETGVTKALGKDILCCIASVNSFDTLGALARSLGNSKRFHLDTSAELTLLIEAVSKSIGCIPKIDAGHLNEISSRFGQVSDA